MAVGRELPLNHVQVGDHIISAGIDQVDQQPGALDVAQEVVPQPCPLGRSSDQTRNVGKNCAITTGTAYHPQVGHQGGEGVIGDLGPSCRKHRNQGALAGIGQADDANFSQQLELQLQQPLLPLPALGELLRGPVAVAEVVGIAQAAAAAKGHQ